MKINLSPQRRDDTLKVRKMGTVLTINGSILDLSEIPEGATLMDAQELHPLLTGNIVHENGDFELTFILPLGANPTQAEAFPEPIVDPEDGWLPFPGSAS